MFEKLTLRNFKNFRDATLDLGPFTVLVGANASGKSNLRDAFRFLHGVGRGYDFAEIVGERFEISGERVWDGIRGGGAQIAYAGEDAFEVSVATTDYRYEVEIYAQSAAAQNQETAPAPLHLVGERLADASEILYEAPSDRDALSIDMPVTVQGPDGDTVALRGGRRRPILSQLQRGELDDSVPGFVRDAMHHVGTTLRSMRFVELDPRALRESSQVGQTTLGDRGQNLASVLMEVCQSEQKKATIVDWLETLTPMDAKDIQFEVDRRSNEVTLVLVEKDGTETPSYSASDGTLRFLGLLALLFQINPPTIESLNVSGNRIEVSVRENTPTFLFLEEIETGLHPTRLALLANLIEQRTRQTDVQVVATTHSPQFLQVLDEETLQDAQLVYRTGNGPEAKICPLLEVPSAREVLAKPNQSVGELHETGWFERVMAFSGGEGVPG